MSKMNSELLQKSFQSRAKFAQRCDEIRKREMRNNCSEFTVSFYEQQQQGKPYYIISFELIRFLNSDVVLYEIADSDGKVYAISRKCALSKKNSEICFKCLDNSERRDRQIAIDIPQYPTRCVHCLFHCPVINVSLKTIGK